MEIHYKILFSFAIIAMLSSCYTDTDNSEVVIVVDQPPAIIVPTTVVGQVFSEDQGNIKEDYALIVNGEQYLNQSAYFSIDLDMAVKTGQSIYVYENDILHSFTHVLLLENDHNYVKLKQFPETTTVELERGFTASISDNLSIFVDDTDLASNLFASLISVKEKDLLRQMGTHAFNENGILLSLQGEEAFYYNPHRGNISTLGNSVMEPIADLNIEGYAEEGMALFYLDEAENMWKEVFSLETGNTLYSDLKKGFYMIGHYSLGSFVEGSMVADDKPVSYQEYEFVESNIIIKGVSTANGKWLSVLPLRQDFIQNVKNPCGEVFFSSNLSSDTEFIEGKIIDLPLGNGNLYEVNTQILDCEGEPVQGGAISINSSSSSADVYPFQSMDINSFVSVCDEEFEVSAFDLESGTEGQSVEWNLDYNHDLDYLINCNELENGFSYIKLKRNGKEEFVTYPSFVVERDGDQTILRSENGEFKLLFKGFQRGEYAEDLVNIAIDDPSFGEFGYEMSCENSTVGCGINEFYVSHYEFQDTETEGGFIRVTFSGELWMSTIAEPRTAGLFPVEGIIIIM